MAVLRESEAYPRAGMPRRDYVKGGPLRATRPMKFAGVEYARGALLPVDKMTPHKHWELWHCGKATCVAPLDSQRVSVKRTPWEERRMPPPANREAQPRGRRR